MISIRQPAGWLDLQRSEIAAVNFETVSQIIVRYYDGRRNVISLFGFSNSALAAIVNALRTVVGNKSTEPRTVGRGQNFPPTE